MVTYKQYDVVVGEGWKKEAAWTAAKILDPTGVLSYADLGRAAMHMGQDFGPGSATLFILALFGALPNFGVLAGGVGAVPWAAAKAAAKGAAKNPKLLAKAGEKVLLALSKTPGAPVAAEKLLAKLESQGVINATQKTLVSNSVKQGKLTLSGVRNKDLGIAAPKGSNATSFAKATPKNIEKAFSGLDDTSKLTGAAKKSAVGGYGRAQLGARLVPRVGDTYNYTTGKINNWAKGQTGGGTGEGDPNAPQTEPGEEVVTYTDPKTGKQIQTTRQALQDAGIAPLQQPQQPVATFDGRALTPAQATALGQFATYGNVPGFSAQAPRQRVGTLAPQNIPQGATQQNPFGRENMAPQQYMKPDNFNNPPNFFNRPQSYNQNQNGNQYGDQASGNIFSGLTSQMAGTPAAGIANLASGLMGVLPGLAGGGGGASMGMNLLGMLPGLMGGI